MNKTLNNIIYFLSAVVFSKILGVGTSFLTAKILEPADYGVLVTMFLIISYAPILCLGTVETLIKQFPYYRGRGELEKARDVEESVLASIVLAALFMVLIGFTFDFFVPIDYHEYSVSIVRMTFITSAICFFSGYFYNRLTAHQNFKAVGLIDTIRAILRFVFLIFLGWLWGLKGVIWGLCVHELLTCLYSAYMSNKACGKIGLNFNPRLMGEMVRIGFPITIVIWIFILQSSADRVVSMSMLGAAKTGYYGLGNSIISMLILIPQVVARVLYPKINEGVGKNLTQQDLSVFVVTPARGLSLILPLLTGILIFTAPPAYALIFPKYLPGLQSAQILLLGSFFTCMLSSGTNYLIAHNRLNVLLAYSLICLAANFTGNIVLVRLGLDINGIAVSACLSGALLTSLIWLAVFKNMGYSGFDQFKKLLSLFSPFFVGGVPVVICLFFAKDALMKPVISLMYASAFFLLYSMSAFTIPPFMKWIKELYILNRKQ
jgi:O-antigen/teichoic acid export membrane protein